MRNLLPPPKDSLILSIAILLASFLSKRIDLYTSLNETIPKQYIWLIDAVNLILIISIGYIVIYYLLKIPPGRWIINFFRKVRNWFHLIYLSSIAGIQYIFVPSERGLSHYEQLIKTALQRSNKIDILLISGFTMYHEQEGFVLSGIEEALKNKSLVRILLWDFNSPAFIKRAEWFIPILKRRDPDKFKDYDINKYKNDCIKIASLLASMPGVECHLYDNEPEWRIHLTDDYVFFSSYLERVEGNKTTVFGIRKTKAQGLYDSFKFHFDSLWNKSSLVGSDLRKFRRFNVALDTEYKKTGALRAQDYTLCRCLNISEKGINLPITIAKNTALDLKIKLSENKEIPITGRVVWASRNSTCGVEFDREIQVS